MGSQPKSGGPRAATIVPWLEGEGSERKRERGEGEGEREGEGEGESNMVLTV